MFKIPDTFTVRKRIVHDNITYNPDDVLSADLVAQMRNSDVLQSMKYIVPTPDPHGRKTDPTKPTPISMPATVRRQMTSVVEPQTLKAEPQAQTTAAPKKTTSKKPAAESKPPAKPEGKA